MANAGPKSPQIGMMPQLDTKYQPNTDAGGSLFVFLLPHRSDLHDVGWVLVHTYLDKWSPAESRLTMRLWSSHGAGELLSGGELELHSSDS